MDEFPRITELRKKLEKDPGSRLFAQLAEELRKAGQLDEAIVEARSGLERQPNYPSARLTLARALLDSGRPEDARPELSEIVKAAPDNILASRLLADSLDALGKPEQAVLQYERTLRLSPDDKAIQAKISELRARLDPAPTPDLRAAPGAKATTPRPPGPPFPAPETLRAAAPSDETLIVPTPVAPPPLDRDLASGTLSGSLNVSELVETLSAPEPPRAPSIETAERAAGLDETIGTGHLPALEMPDDEGDAASPVAVSTDEAALAEAPSDPSAASEVRDRSESRSTSEPPGLPSVETPVEASPPEPEVVSLGASDELDAAVQPEPLEHGNDEAGGRTLPLSSVTLADLYLQQGLKAEASAVLAKVLKAEPDNQEARLKLEEVSRSEPVVIPAEAPASPVRVPRTRATKRAETIASLNALLAAVEREAIEQRASERGAL